MSDIAQTAGGNQPARSTSWQTTWWKILDYNIGIVPLPFYFVTLALIWAFLSLGHGKISSDILMSIAILAIGGFTCGELGKRLPIIKNFGAAAIFATFLPSYLVYAHILPSGVVASTKSFFQSSNILYLYIACIIVGSIMAMDRESLIKGAVKICIPLCAGVVVAGAAGTLLGTVLGLGTYHTFFYIVMPMLSGGVGEGVIPLSVGYALLNGGDQGGILAEIMPMVMMGSFCCIVFASVLNLLGKKKPHLTGNGVLAPGGSMQIGDIKAGAASGKPLDPTAIAAAGVVSVVLYLIGVVGQQLFDFPAPVSMLFIVFVMKVAHLISPRMAQSGHVLNRFFASSVTYPLLFSVGVSITPWEKLISAFTFLNVVVVVFTVVCLLATGFIVGKLIRLYPIDTAVVCSCSAAQGGTGNVAILTATERLELMPFASIATRIGGAVVVTLALSLMRLIG